MRRFLPSLADGANLLAHSLTRGKANIMTDIQNIPVRRIDGSETTLADYAGKVLLVVNVASKCGLTPQYEALESLYRMHRDWFLVLLWFPCYLFKG